MVGDFGFGAYISAWHVWSLTVLGTPLSELEEQSKKLLAFLVRNRHASEFNMHVALGLVANLKGTAQETFSFNSPLFQESIVDKIAHKVLVYWFYLAKLQMFFVLEKYPEAYLVAEKVRKNAAAPFGLIILPEYYYYGALLWTADYSSASVAEQNMRLKQLKIHQKKLKKWAADCPENFLHKFYLVSAEIARINDDILDAMRLYDQAIEEARKNDFTQHEALANELAAKFYLTQGKHKFASSYLIEARYAYQKWGADAKVLLLDATYPELINHLHDKVKTVNKLVTVTRTGSKDELDLGSLMKASQVISGEILLENLLRRMMTVVIENAGAQRGVLLLEKHGQWFIEAEINLKQITILKSIPLHQKEAESPLLPVSIILYVIRTKDGVLLQDAVRDSIFNQDPYILIQRPKSVLAKPLLNQGKLSAILYLENSLISGAFTENRLEVLNMLSAQIAVSIENARLYHNLTEFNRAYERFVPKEFLSFLGKDSIVDVKLGDQVEREMTILFSDIRGFTMLSEQMTPQENFNFINSYLSKMEPMITNYHGFIDKYIGDAIMALFPTNADDAVNGSIGMLTRLEEYNVYRVKNGFSSLRIGIGLNTGRLMLGTVGGERRLNGTVISDSVNLASRIEGMTKTYGASLLISEFTFYALQDVTRYHIRFADRVAVKGKSEPVTIFEVLDGEPAEFKIAKIKTLKLYEEGISLYFKRDFVEASQNFEACLKQNPNDKAVQLYLDRCLQFKDQDLTESWDGVTRLQVK